jgi:RNA polymerase sigma factor (sigma-70 family)
MGPKAAEQRACEMRRHDPLANPQPLIRRVYSYVAYLVGDGPEAEDITNDVFERALRYRSSYDPNKGEPVTWLLGIARRAVSSRRQQTAGVEELDADHAASPGDLEADTIRRLDLAVAFARLAERDRELLALRFAGDLTARQIAQILELKTNAVEVALHRALARLRAELEHETPGVPEPGSALRAPAAAPIVHAPRVEGSLKD